MSNMVYLDSAYFKEHPKTEVIKDEDWEEEFWNMIEMCMDEVILNADWSRVQAYSAEEIAKGIKILEEQNGINRSDTR